MAEYITKQQAIDLAESLRPIAGNGITDAFIKGIEGLEEQKPHVLPDAVWYETKLEYRPEIGRNIKHSHIVTDTTYPEERIEAVLREVLKQVLTVTDEERYAPLI